MVQKIHPRVVIWGAFFPSPMVIFSKKSAECSVHLYSSPCSSEAQRWFIQGEWTVKGSCQKKVAIGYHQYISTKSTVAKTANHAYQTFSKAVEGLKVS